jgi:hypothetical protein
VIAAALLASASATPSARAADDVVDLPVSFAVHNTNTSGVSCQTDGAPYTIHGHLVGPRSMLINAAPRAVTLYLHDLGDGEWFFRFSAVPGHDFAVEMARMGHVSLTVADLGYLPSGQPLGMQSCAGGHADVIHQIVGQVRSGSYGVQGLTARAFTKVVVGAFSYGALEAQIEAYSYKDIDGLAIFGYSDQGASQRTTSTGIADAPGCTAGGKPANGETGPSGYFDFDSSEAGYEDGLFNVDNADPAVVAAAGQLRARAPCGDLLSLPQGLATDVNRLGEVTVPVLLVYGRADKIYPAEGEPSQRGEFSGTSDITSAFLDNTGHAFTLERSAPTFRSIVSAWLLGHRFVSARSQPPGGPALAVTPRVKLGSEPVRVTRTRLAAVRVACLAPRQVTCRGTLALALVAVRGGHRGTPRATPIGAHAFSVPGGKAAIVRVRISRSAYRRLLRGGRILVEATAALRVDSHKTVRTRRRLELRRPR